MNGDSCRNCTAPLAGRYCHACGQDSRDPLRDFGALSSEFLDSMFGWDSRLVRTLRLLFGSPGALTLEFVAGRRMRDLGPLRLYLIASLVFFASYSLGPDPVLATIAGLGDPQTGWTRIAYIARWLPTMMIVILPMLAAAMHLLFRGVGRPFLASLVWTLHFGAVSFIAVPIGHLFALALIAGGVGPARAAPIYAAHAFNAVYLYLMARRFYGLAPATTLVKLLGFAASMTLALGGIASLAQHVIERLSRGG